MGRLGTRGRARSKISGAGGSAKGVFFRAPQFAPRGPRSFGWPATTRSRVQRGPPGGGSAGADRKRDRGPSFREPGRGRGGAISPAGPRGRRPNRSKTNFPRGHRRATAHGGPKPNVFYGGAGGNSPTPPGAQNALRLGPKHPKTRAVIQRSHLPQRPWGMGGRLAPKTTRAWARPLAGGVRGPRPGSEGGQPISNKRHGRDAPGEPRPASREGGFSSLPAFWKGPGQDSTAWGGTKPHGAFPKGPKKAGAFFTGVFPRGGGGPEWGLRRDFFFFPPGIPTLPWGGGGKPFPEPKKQGDRFLSGPGNKHAILSGEKRGGAEGDKIFFLSKPGGGGGRGHCFQGVGHAPHHLREAGIPAPPEEVFRASPKGGGGEPDLLGLGKATWGPAHF